MASIIEKRFSLHKQSANQRKQNETLKMQVSQLQALANVGTATCMIAHEINNLLTPIANYATLAMNNPDDKSLTEKTLQKTARNCQRASKIVESLVAVVNSEKLEKKETRLIKLVEEVFECLCRDFAKDGITLNIQIPEELMVWAVPAEIQQVLMNLILNARDAMLGGGGVLTIKTEEDADTVTIELTDTGCGIEKDNLEKIFEPFFSTKADKKSQLEKTGFGLGLAFCKKVVDGCGGYILVASKPAEGTSFIITMPKKVKA